MIEFEWKYHFLFLQSYALGGEIHREWNKDLY